MSEKNGVSIKTISLATGVSTATVSRVLNDAGGFSPETRDRVLKAAESLGYVPNAMARALRTQSSPLVGIIVPDITNDFFSRIVLRVQLSLSQHGYSAFICNTDESHRMELSYLDTLQKMQISGLVCISGYDRETDRWPNVPTVYIDRDPAGRAEASTVIESDNLAGSRMAAEELIRRKCRRIAILRDNRPLSTIDSRERGFRMTLEKAGLKMDEGLRFCVSRVDEKHGYDAVAYALQTGAEFDGIFCCTDWLAIGALKALGNAGLQVPENVRVVGFDDALVAAYNSIPLTTVHQDTDGMSRIAVEELVRMMEGQKCQRDRWVIPVSLIRRETT